MKKLFYLFVPLLALLLTLVPMTVQAQVNEYFNIYNTDNSYSAIKIRVKGNPGIELYYSTDKNTWTEITTSGSSTETVKLTLSGAATTYYFKGNNSTPFHKDDNNYVHFSVYSSQGGTAYIRKLAGNIMSLVYGDDFQTEGDVIPCDYCFKNLFAGSAYKVDASALSLPATTLTTGCYYGMFESSGSYWYLTGFPKLPAQNLKPYCYARMFAKTNLSVQNGNNTSIILPAEELADHCYEQMFEMNSVPSGGFTRTVEIMATTLRDREGNLYTNPLQEMFKYTGSSSNTLQYGYSKVGIYFSEWGQTTYSTTTTAATTNPTYNWWGGYYNNSSSYQGRLAFYHDNNLYQSKTTSGSSTSKKASFFPQYCTLNKGTDVYGNTIDSVVFNCAANEGYWNEGLTYNANLRRVVRSDYTMKTVPAAPYNKDGKRFIGWFTSPSDAGSLVTENQLKAMTSGTTVYARFASDSEYVLYIEPSDKATITATDGTDNFTAGTVYLRTAAEAARTITLSTSDETSGYSFYKYTRDGSEIVGNNATFGTSKDLMLGAIIVGTSSSVSKDVTVYQAGTGAGTSSQYDLPSQAVDLGEAGIWAKYNVDKDQSSGFATSETATGSYFTWGTLTVATDAGSTGGYYEGSQSMSSGDNLPVTEETDAAYKYCGHIWRIATYEEWANLLANVNVTTINTYDRKLTSKTNSNYIIIPHNGSRTSSGTTWANSIQYWTATFATTDTYGSAKAWGYSTPSNQWGNPPSAPTLNSDKTGSQGTGAIFAACGIRPILSMDMRKLTIHSNGYTYIYNCELYQQMTITANAAEGFSFKEWQDAAGNVVSTSNPLVVKMYHNLTYTAVYKESAGAQHEVVFYDYDGDTFLERKNVYEDATITYTGETPTRSGYEFIGWDRALGTMGKADVSFTAQYVQTFTLTLSGSNMSFTMTADGYDPQTTSGTYRSGTDVTITATVTNDAYKFSKWSDDVVTCSRVVKLTENTALSASYQLVSDNQSVNVYQGAAADTMRILYNLDARTGDDGLTYQPVDMGYGVAWADRNVGATSTNNLGSRFYWGGTSARTSFNSSTGISNISSFSTGDQLSSAQDAAYVNMGSSWRMPNGDDFLALLDNTTISNDNTFTNKTNTSLSIILPAGGYQGSSIYDLSNQYYWTNEYALTGSDYLGATYNCYAFVRFSTNTYHVSATNMTDSYGNEYYLGMPVRAIYEPEYQTYTLTINVGTKRYQYICQAGQNITVTANATVSGYVFDEWTEDGNTDAERTFTVTGNMSYTATFTATPKPAELHIVLEEAEDNDYYDDFSTRYGGKTANTVTLNRQFEQGRWSTLCLPFEVSGGMMTTLKMSGRVYEFKYATGNANVGSGVNLYFSNAKKMEAGKGYIVNADAKLAEKTSFVFSNVKIDVSKDLGKALNSKEAYDNLSNANGYKTKGNIELVGTLRNGTLKGSDTGNTYMGLKSNKIYYPNISQGSTIWAYRGIFRSTETLNIEKMRIIVDGEDRGEIIIDADGDVRAPSDAPSRKFIRDGVLYIEREGVVYDAQGKRVEGAF